MVDAPASPAIRQNATGEVGQPERVVEFAVGEQAGVGGDAATVEFELQPTVEIDPQSTVIRFARRVFHEHVTQPQITR